MSWICFPLKFTSNALKFDGLNTIITFRGTNLSVGHFAFSLELSQFLPIEERFMRQVRDFTSKAAAAALQRIFKITLGVKQSNNSITDAYWRMLTLLLLPATATPTEFIKWEREIFYPKRSIGNKKESLQLRNYLSRKNFVWSFNLSKKVPKTILKSVLKKQYNWAFTPSKIYVVICITCHLCNMLFA